MRKTIHTADMHEPDFDKLRESRPWWAAAEKLRGKADPKPMTNDETLADLLRRDPGKVMLPLGVTPDPWQLDLLTLPDEVRRVLVCNCRQSGKTFGVAGMALNEALTNGPTTVLILSPSQRQSKEVLRNVKDMHAGLKGDQVKRKIWNPRTLKYEVGGYNQTLQQLMGSVRMGEAEDAVRDNTEEMVFGNGSRIVSLPGKQGTVRGYTSVSLLILDEAAQTPDELYKSLSATRAVVGGRVVVLSTPFGKRGWFWEIWNKCEEAKAKGKPTPWKQISVKAEQITRIKKDFLEEERFDLGDMWYAQEYEVAFLDVINAVFNYTDVQNMTNDPAVEELKIEGVDYSVGPFMAEDEGVEELVVQGVDN